MSFKNKSILSIFLFLIILLIFSSAVSANNFTQLQDEIDNSISNEISLNSSIVLDNNEVNKFTDGIIINKSNIEINGNGFTINGTSANGTSVRIFNIQANNVIIKNIVLTGAKSGNGSAIYNIANNTQLYNVTVINNIAETNGGGIFNFKGNDFKVTDCIFENNQAYSVGGAIANLDGDNFLVTGYNQFLNNNIISYSGGAIANSGSNFKIKGNNTFKNNNGSLNGGAIVNEGINFTVTGENSFINNFAIYGGAIVNIGDNFLINGSNIFESNLATRYAGAVYNEGDYFTIYGNNIFENNTVLSNNSLQGGGAIFNKEANQFLITGSNIFKSNIANTSSGGAIANNGPNFTINGANIFEDNIANYGGAICIDYTENFKVIGSNSFLGNIAISQENRESYGGAIYLYKSNNSEIIGGNFYRNDAFGGAGIFIDESNNSTLNNLKLINNTANYAAGIGIYVSENIKITNNFFNNNIADFFAGDIVNEDASIYLKNNTMDLNKINIFSNGTITSPVFLTFLDNSTLNVNKSSIINLTAVLKDELGNIIIGQNITFNINNQTLKTNKTSDDGKYFVEFNANIGIGNYLVTGSVDLLDNLTIKNGQLNVIGLSIDADDILMYYRNGTQYIARLSYNGVGIANEIIYITLRGSTYNRTTDSEGNVYLNLNLNPGNYTITAFYNNSEYLSVNNTIEVLPTILAENLIKYFRNDSQFYAQFLDDKGNPITNTSVTFNINGVFYTRLTNGSGISRLNINLNPNTYILTATHPNSKLNMSYNITVLPHIVGKDLVKYYKNASQYEVKILNDQGVAVTNVNVTFNINGVFYTRTTDSNGIAKLTINLNPGNYTISSRYGDLTMSNEIEVLPVIVGKDISMTTTNRVPYEVTILDSQGKNLANQLITVNINGVHYIRITDNQGLASININLDPGKYIATTNFSDLLFSNNIEIKQG